MWAWVQQLCRRRKLNLRDYCLSLCTYGRRRTILHLVYTGDVPCVKDDEVDGDVSKCVHCPRHPPGPAGAVRAAPLSTGAARTPLRLSRHRNSASRGYALSTAVQFFGVFGSAWGAASPPSAPPDVELPPSPRVRLAGGSVTAFVVSSSGSQVVTDWALQSFSAIAARRGQTVDSMSLVSTVSPVMHDELVVSSRHGSSRHGSSSSAECARR